jgi:hypothetical protein
MEQIKAIYVQQNKIVNFIFTLKKKIMFSTKGFNVVFTYCMQQGYSRILAKPGRIMLQIKKNNNRRKANNNWINLPLAEK